MKLFILVLTCFALSGDCDFSVAVKEEKALAENNTLCCLICATGENAVRKD